MYHFDDIMFNLEIYFIEYEYDFLFSIPVYL